MREYHGHIYTTMCKQVAGGEAAVWHRALNLVLCDSLEGWDEGQGEGEVRREGEYAYLWLIHIVVWQKPTQYCKAIILQLKINF